MAEALITLGIIGVVAAITLPTLIKKIDEIVLRNQFKKTYSLLSQAIVKTQADLGYSPACYSRKFVKYSTKCGEYNELGVCIKSVLLDGSPVPGDMWGELSECETVFWDSYLKNLKVIKSCENKGFEEGCVPEYKGRDDIAMDSYDKNEEDEDYDADYGKKKLEGCGAWYTDHFKNSPAYVLSDGTIISFAYGLNKKNVYDFAVDINGKKGPNKLGYDVFAFKILNPDSAGRDSGVIFQLANADCFTGVEIGGKTTEQMINSLYNK